MSDADITSFIAQATAQVNSYINIKVIRERILQIDNTRKNQINGTNATYYVKNWEGKYISDANDDGAVTTADVTVYQVASDGTETVLSVSSVDFDDGKIVLTSAPTSGVRLYITYQWSWTDASTPDVLVENATSFLVAAYCFEKINRGLSPQQVFGNVRLMRDMEAGNEFYKKYQMTIQKMGTAGEIAWTEAPIF